MSPPAETPIADDEFTGTLSSNYRFDSRSWEPVTQAIRPAEGATVLSYQSFADGFSSEVRSMLLRYDGTPPTAPGSLLSSNVSVSGFKVSWSGSSDLVSGLREYRVFKDGALWATTDQQSVVFTSLDPATTFEIGIEALDEAGNPSPRTTLTVATSSVGDDTIGLDTGEGVIADLPLGGSLEFEQVVSEGDVHFSRIPPRNVPTGPQFAILPNGYFDIHADAGFDGVVTLMLAYDPTQIQGWSSAGESERLVMESNLKLRHRKSDGSVEDITTSVDTVNKTITGRTASFSDFWIEYPVGSGTWINIGASAEMPPIGWAVVATGLLGMGYMARRRRCTV